MFVRRRMLALTARVRGYVAAGVLTALGVTALRVAAAVLVARLLARALDGAEPGELTGLFAALLAAILVRALLLWWRELLAGRAAAATRERVRIALFDKLFELGPGYVAERRSGELRATVLDGVEALGPYVSRYLPALANALVAPLGIVVYLLFVAPGAALAALAGAVVALVLPAVWVAMRAESSGRVWREIGGLDAEYTDTIQGLLTLKAFNATARRRAVIAARADAVRVAVMKELRVSLLHVGFSNLGTVGGTAAALGWALWSAANGGLDAIGLLTVLVVMREIYRPLDEVGRYAFDAITADNAVGGIDELLTAQPRTPEPVRPVGPAGGLPPRIEFEDVTYRYPGRDRDAVHGISLASPRARPSRWSARRAPARAPWRCCCCASPTPTPAGS
ncbi:ABC transporter transmembrane domain-containing protein [Jiangella anatolica]|uniref:ABC transporter transmembrane domain-containing protein n=1 Tax=Jiangella anatolica TaxID=2670374 RepID=UPI0018F788D3|nr:ABC transporter transmembrane domain-containing protein [Jiangella anatolica]